MHKNPHDVALAVVKKFASDEEPAFETAWDNAGGADASLRDAPGQFVGIDTLTAPLLAAVIVPIVVEFGKRLADDGADVLFRRACEYLKIHRKTDARTLSDEDINEIAQEITDQFTSSGDE